MLINQKRNEIHTMKQILFPVDKDLCAKAHNHTSKSSTWEALNPLQMAEKIAQMVGSQPECLNEASLQIHSSFLAQESANGSFIPRNASGEVPPATAAKVDDDYVVELSTENTTRTKRSIYGQEQSQKGNLPILVPVAEDSKTLLMPWDLSFLLTYNPHDITAKLAVKELSSLAEKLESMPSYGTCHSSYKRFRDSLLEETRLLFEDDTSDQQKNLLFGHIYSDAIQLMKALIAMAEKIEKDDESKNEKRKDHSRKAGLANMKAKKIRERRIKIEEGDDNHPIFRRVYEKKAFTEYMNQWLIQNWTNPYPDDDGLEELAEINGTTTTIVSNWLINARTRKWRPAIVKAYESGRAADLLKEDSINIFKRKAVRKL
jgi:hypothetical protein